MNEQQSDVVAHSAVVRTIRVGGISKLDLRTRLEEAKVQFNESARLLFSHDRFITSPTDSMIETVEVSVADLGFPEGARIDTIYNRAAECGLSLCPLELAPHLRLQHLDQPEGSIGYPPSKHRAPPGALTVASRELCSDEAVPKGFYLRRIEGELWLRGYRSNEEHVWNAGDRFVFCRAK